jgi:Flp pilus assembly protein TadG
MSAYVKRMLEEQRGTTLVEFALVTPVLILVLVASLDFARALNAYVTVTNASREARATRSSIRSRRTRASRHSSRRASFLSIRPH